MLDQSTAITMPWVEFSMKGGSRWNKGGNSQVSESCWHADLQACMGNHFRTGTALQGLTNTSYRIDQTKKDSIQCILAEPSQNNKSTGTTSRSKFKPIVRYQFKTAFNWQ
jgi:hypothetical protein